MNWYLKAWRNTSDISGRARRREFWYFIIVFAALLAAPYLVEAYLLKTPDYDLATAIYAVVFFVHFAPLISVTIRRLHDINLSGWWVLLAFNPLGMLIFGYFFLKDSYFNYNQWGPVPKEMPAEELNEP
jgi:uncharacterized membrane protein YhaH (DUF805 family)